MEKLVSSVQKLKGAQNYPSWAMETVGALEIFDLEYLLEVPEAGASAAEKKKREKDEKKAHGLILLCLDDACKMLVSKETTGSGILRHLAALFADKSQTRLAHLHAEFNALEISKDEKVMTFGGRVLGKQAEITMAGGTLDDVQVCLRILDGVRKVPELQVAVEVLRQQEEWDPARCLSQLSMRESSVTRSGVVQGLQSVTSSMACAAVGNAEHRTCFKCGERGHLRPDCPNPPMQKVANKKKGKVTSFMARGVNTQEKGVLAW